MTDALLLLATLTAGLPSGAPASEPNTESPTSEGASGTHEAPPAALPTATPTSEGASSTHEASPTEPDEGAGSSAGSPADSDESMGTPRDEVQAPPAGSDDGVWSPGEDVEAPPAGSPAGSDDGMWSPGEEVHAPPAGLDDGMWSPGEEVQAPPAGSPADSGESTWSPGETPGAPEVAVPAAPWVAAEDALAVNGYAELRLAYADVDVHGLVPTRDVPMFHTLLEANVQLRWRWGELAFLVADVSGVYQRGIGFFSEGPQGNRRQSRDHDVPSLRPFVSFNELYASVNVHDHLNVTLGRQRTTWGAGFMLNPTDILNPPKDPTDPTAQRAGAWLLKVEAPFERFTLTAVISPQVTRQAGGIPTAFLVYPEYPTYETSLTGRPYEPDDSAHWALLLRGYALVWDTDVNLSYIYTNLYQDAFADHSRVALSLSRYVIDALELHVEGLGELGSARRYVDPTCVADPVAALGCLQRGTPLFAHSRLHDEQFRAQLVAGGRYSFADESLLSVEYSYAGDGYDDDEYAAYTRALTLVRQAQRAGLLPAEASSLSEPAADTGVPQKNALELLRQHYLYVTYTKPRIFDDFTASAVLILSLHDLSGQLAPSLTWSTTEWLQLGLFAFITLPGFGGLAPSLGPGDGQPELALSPLTWRVLASARVFY